MIDRFWWFFAGVVTGGLIMVRALRRRPTPRDLKGAAMQTTADLLDIGARAIRPPTRS